MKRTVISLGIIFFASFLFRLWFAGLVPQPFVYDQDEYYGYALGIINKGLHADIYRLYGYPLLVTPIIYFFGVDSPIPWTVFHSLLDATTTLFVFILSRKLFKDKKISWISSILYALNPYTAGYVGVLLSEVATIFLLTLLVLLLFVYLEKNKQYVLFLLALILGYLPQVRPSFIFISAMIYIFVIVNMLAKGLTGQRFKIVVVSIILFCLPFSYNVVTNLYHYQEVALLSVDRIFERELYTSLFIARGMPFTDTTWGAWPSQAQEAWGAFSAPKNHHERDVVAKKYMAIALEKIRKDPGWYIQTRLQKMLYVWEKHFVYPYVMGPMSPLQKFFIYWINVSLVGLGVIGMIIYTFFWKNISYPQKIIGRVSILFIIYISVIHNISTSEERFSLPAYPLLFLFAGYSLFTGKRYALKLLHKFRI